MKINFKKYLKPKIILHWIVLAAVVYTAITTFNLSQWATTFYFAIAITAVIIAITDIILEEALGI